MKNNLEFPTHTHKLTRLFIIEKPVLNAGLGYTNQDQNSLNTYLDNEHKPHYPFSHIRIKWIHRTKSDVWPIFG